MPDRYLVEPEGRLWKVTDLTTGESFLHHTEVAARLAAHDDITTGIVPTTQEE